MEKYLSEIENVKPIATSARHKNFRHLYAVLCGIESEYALKVLKKNKDDTVIKHISSYYLSQDTSAKSLFSEFIYDSEMAELHSLLDFDEKNEKSIQDVLSRVKWICHGNENTFCIGEFSFSSEKTFLDLKEYAGKYYFLERKTASGEDDVFDATGCLDIPDNLCYKASYNIRGLLNGNDVWFDRYKYSNVPRIQDSEFFNATGKLKESDDEQRTAIRAEINQNLLIIAGAGSGKTRSLVGRLAYLHLVRGIPLNKIMLLTFTRAATQEMAAAANKQIAEAYLFVEADSTKLPHVLSGTIDGFFKQLIEKFYIDIGLTQKPKFWFDSRYKREKYALLLNVIKENHLDNVFSKILDGERGIAELYRSLDSLANGVSVNISGLDTLLSLFVEKQIKENTIVDFVYSGYILNKALENKNCALYKHLEDLYDCILIDEFQDINKLQNSVLSKFYDSTIHFTFVGDDDQTIYSWRGADNDIIKNMAKDANVQTIYLTTNYRNNPYIVNAGNDILATLEDRAKTGRAIKAAKIGGSKVRLVKYDSRYENLAYEIKKVYESRQAGEKICVLLRQVNDTSKLIEGNLQRIEGEGTKLARMLEINDVPYVIGKDEGVELSVGYKIFKALLFIHEKIDVRNNCAFIKEIMDVPEVSNIRVRQLVLGKTNPAKIPSKRNTSFTPESIAALGESINSNFSFARNMLELVSNFNRVFAERIELQRGADRVIQDCTLAAFQSMTSEYDWNYPAKKDYLKKIFALFEQEISKNATKNYDEDKDPIIISSIHKAKGLQYDTVFIVGLNEGEYPNNEQIKAEYDRRVKSIERLRQSKNNLATLRTLVTEESITKLKDRCSQLSQSKKYSVGFSDDMRSMCDEIDALRDDYAKLTDEGVDAFLEAYYTYVDGHLTEFKDAIAEKQKKIDLLQEESDNAEELYHESEENSVQSETLYNEWQNIEKKIGINKSSLEEYMREYNEFVSSMKEIIAFYEICNEAKGYFADARKLRNQSALIEELERNKKEKEEEEKRLFYVAVSRASERLYLCSRQGAVPSPFVRIINKAYCEPCTMLTQYQENEINRLKPEINSINAEIKKAEVDHVKVDNSIEKILNYSEGFKAEMQNDINKFLEQNTQYKDLPDSADKYLQHALGLQTLGARLGYNFNVEIAHNVQRLVEVYIEEKIGPKAKPYKCDTKSAKLIATDIRRIAKAKCMIVKTGIPGEQYIVDLLTKEMKYKDELSRCKSLIIQCYIVCSGRYIIPEMISDTWKFKKFTHSNPDEFLAAALDLTNIRNIGVHPKGDDVWETDYQPHLFGCLDVVMKYFRSPQIKVQVPTQDLIEEQNDLSEENKIENDLRLLLGRNIGKVRNFKAMQALIADMMDPKTAKRLCLVDERIMKDIVSGLINSNRGMLISYMRTKCSLSNEECLSILSIWEDVIEGNLKVKMRELLKK